MEQINYWPTAYTVDVVWGDMDSFQHVNNVLYLRWFESARAVYLSDLGYQDMLKVGGQTGIGPILARTEINYHMPVEYPDTVTVNTTISKMGNTSFVMPMQIHSKAKNQIVATGEAVIVLFDYRHGQKMALSEELREKIRAFSRL